MVAESMYSPEALSDIHTVRLQRTNLPCDCFYIDSFTGSGPPHQHIGLEVLYCLEGEAVMTIEDKRVPVRGRRLTILNPLKSHYLRVVKGSRYRRYVLHLLPERLWTVPAGKGRSVDSWPWTPWCLAEPVWQTDLNEETHARVTRIFEEILYESAVRLPSSFEMICHLLNQFFIIVRRLLLAHNHRVSEEHEESLDMIRSIISFIEAHYAKNIRTSDIAASIGFSPSRACHAFKRATGKTISHYLHEVRIQRAKNLLLMSDQQVAAIAYEVGYNDLSYFNRWFRAITGLSPSDFRKRFRKSAALR